jgi:squalene synthase HpnC
VTAATEDGATTLPRAAAVMDRASHENFPVASRLLPRRERDDLLAIYGYARLVDDAGDEAAGRRGGGPMSEPGRRAGRNAAGDRAALLDEIEGELDRIYAGAAPRHALMTRLAATVRARALPRAPLDALIEANRRDQEVASYATFAELLGYCELSANPVGRLVLHVFGAATPERIALSDRVCTALQLAEHWQDVAEDLGRGRVYVPAEDRERFGVSTADLAGHPATPPVRALMTYEVARARRILAEGAPLVSTLRGRPRLAVAAFVGGGNAALDAIDRAGGDVSAGPPQATRAARGRATVRALVARRRPRRSQNAGPR